MKIVIGIYNYNDVEIKGERMEGELIIVDIEKRTIGRVKCYQEDRR